MVLVDIKAEKETPLKLYLDLTKNLCLESGALKPNSFCFFFMKDAGRGVFETKMVRVLYFANS
jgi:hypothetical protein